MKQKSFYHYVPALLLSLILLAGWESLVRASIINNFILPAPSSILSALINNWNIIAVHTWQTLVETIIGFAIAIILGLLIALSLDFSPWIRKSVYPLLVTSQTIPMIALAPLLLIWFGFDLLPKVIIVVLYCFFPIVVAVADGLSAINPELVKLLKSMGANDWQILRLVKLPGALPNFFSGLRIAATYSVTAAIVGEYVGAYQGLGIYMQTSANSHAISLVFAAIVVTAILSLVLFGLVGIAERLMLPWYSR